VSKFKRPFKVTLTDADGTVIESWRLMSRAEVPFESEECWVDNDGSLGRSSAEGLGLAIRAEINRIV
jgi:hypothetical protein